MAVSVRLVITSLVEPAVSVGGGAVATAVAVEAKASVFEALVTAPAASVEANRILWREVKM